MNKMTVIQLLNKIANGEEVPKKVKLGNIIWNYDEKEKTYFMNNTEIELFYIEKITKKLNDEVEIIEEEPRDIEVCGTMFTRSEYNKLAGIEEDKKIEKLKDVIKDGCIEAPNNFELMDKINELIEVINEKL